MAERASFDDVVIDVEGNALADVEVTVYEGTSLDLATIYTTRSGGGTKANPYTTTSTGLFSFFADPGVYRIEWSDTEIPARISDRTIYWDSVSGDTAGIPADRIDGALGYDQIALDVVQYVGNSTSQTGSFATIVTGTPADAGTYLLTATIKGLSISNSRWETAGRVRVDAVSQGEHLHLAGTGAWTEGSNTYNDYKTDVRQYEITLDGSEAVDIQVKGHQETGTQPTIIGILTLLRLT